MNMGKHPAIIIIARHGARLDQADKQWHFTSPTPYDPPLTYGGWTQSRALGLRIASILQQREDAGRQEIHNGMSNGDVRHEASAEPVLKSRRRKHKVIIHSSPFVRCIQTSIAISAGLAQFQKRIPSIAQHGHHVLHSGSPRIHATDNSTRLPAIPEPHDSPRSARHQSQHQAPDTQHWTCELRVDAFLGEWLSPDYFENITPPPSSIMMVASAKAELLRPAEHIEGMDSQHKTQGYFPGGWKMDWSPISSAGESPIEEEEEAAEEKAKEKDENAGLANMAAFAHSLPHRTRATTHTGDRLKTRNTIKSASNAPKESSTYMPPIPTYAISSSNPIPVGYVAHARDACVDVRYQWDSMRPPVDWGNGGEYGEEWSSMHKRFRTGLQRMVGWYEERGTSLNDRSSDCQDPDQEIVLVLVTHGAGCNALIGALSNQPVLLDVGMSSLTMAVLKDDVADVEPTPSPPPKRSRSGSIDLGIADEYEMKIVASTEHLRATSTPLGSPGLRSSPVPSNRRPFIETEKFTIGDPATRSHPAVGVHRSTSAASSLRPFLSAAPRMSSGLWRSGTGQSIDGTSESSESDSMPNFSRASPGTVADGADAAEEKVKKAEMSNGSTPEAKHIHMPTRTASQRGLWGSGTAFIEERENAPKRRWTVLDRHDS